MEIPLLHRQFVGKFHPQIKNVRPWYTIGLIGNFSVLPAGNNLCISEFAKLRALRALRVFVSSHFTCLAQALYIHASRDFFKCLAHLVCVP